MTEHSALTPAGQIEQAGLLAAGLRHPRTGWRRAIATTGLIILAAAAAFVIVFAVLDH